jgi:molybdopterin molybdotransferase
VSEALQRLLSHFSPLETEQIELTEAAGRVLAEQVVAGFDLPPFPNSSMDGFALLASDVGNAGHENPVSLEVVADVPAGQVVHLTLQSGQAARIMTGAPLPPGAEAVIPVEDTDFQYRQPGVRVPKRVQVFRPVYAGENVRPGGQDVRSGEVVMHPGFRLRPQDIGFLSMLGIAQVPVHKIPSIAIFSTGDELLPVHMPLMPGKIHDSNTYTLIALVEQTGGRAVNLGIVPDRAEEVQACLDRGASAQVDLILSSAGVSVGAFDFVRSVVEQHGHLDFWRVNMRPGKPLAFGNYKGIPFIGLPGNPVSAFIGFEVFARPALLKMAGISGVERYTQRVRLLEDISSDGRESYLRAIVSFQDGHLVARLTGHQGSGNLRSLVQANALLLVPSGVKSLPSGAEVDAWLLGQVK